MREIRNRGGHANFLTSNLKDQESVVWVFPRYPNSSQVDVEELTRVEFQGLAVFSAVSLDTIPFSAMMSKVGH